MKIINAYQEFGFILMYYAPIAYDLYLNGNLKQTVSRPGSSDVFYFSKNHQEIKGKANVPFEFRNNCYFEKPPKFTKKNWTPPPYKEQFKNNFFKYDKPILTIHNKNTLEWTNSGIWNYFNKQQLRKLFNEFYDNYQIIYIRPINNNLKKGYVGDERQKTIDIGDYDLIKNEFPNVLWIGDLLNDYNFNYNKLQFMLLSNSEYHISPAGDSVIPSYFGGDTIVYRHPNCQSSSRKIWHNGTWLKKLSNSNIYNFDNFNRLLTFSKNKWK